jgi:hypothetical protein
MFRFQLDIFYFRTAYDDKLSFVTVRCKSVAIFVGGTVQR